MRRRAEGKSVQKVGRLPRFLGFKLQMSRATDPARKDAKIPNIFHSIKVLSPVRFACRGGREGGNDKAREEHFSGEHMMAISPLL